MPPLSSCLEGQSDMAGLVANTVPIEAKSLSLLTNIASNPPQNLVNTHQRNPPLVLYIARVPGSKDVFLSPMKPRDKVVTAEDVQSSLYYIHVDRPDDESLLKLSNAFRDDLSINEADEPPSPRKVLRKPVLPARVPSRDLSSTDHPVATNCPAGLLSQQQNTIVNSNTPLNSRTNSECRQNVASAAFTRKPVAFGMTSPKQPSATFDDLLVGNENQRVDQRRLPQYSHNHAHPLPPIPPSEHELRPGFGDLRPDMSLLRHNSLGRTAAAVPQSSGFDGKARYWNVPTYPRDGGSIQSQEPGISLTLIRRDPASGDQWNVGKVLDPPLHEISSSASSQSWTSEKRKRLGTPIYLDISNPGYAKFVESKSAASSRASTYAAQVQDDVNDNPKTFERRLWMEGARFTEARFGHRKNQSNVSEHRALFDVEDGPLRRDDQSYLVPEDTSSKRSTFRGYVFETPWKTRCEFVTGGGGGSLRCIHIPVSNGGIAPIPTSVSELRFNLPSAFSRTHSRQPSDDASSKRRSFFSKSKLAGSLAEMTRASMHEDDRLDLALGQETAGGGFGGKHAKLGKLIIEDEGFQMIDLLVAANMGLWWRAYER